MINYISHGWWLKVVKLIVKHARIVYAHRHVLLLFNKEKCMNLISLNFWTKCLLFEQLSFELNVPNLGSHDVIYWTNDYILGRSCAAAYMGPPTPKGTYIYMSCTSTANSSKNTVLLQFAPTNVSPHLNKHQIC